jgi:hypothetical protein
MYETVDSVFIGVNNGSDIKTIERSSIFRNIKPIVFYGTSIVEGASAMRPGMAYPSIISRRLGVEAINLGFSGNALLDKPIGEAMAEINASCYVMDCGPNLSPLLVENIVYPHARFDQKVRMKVDSTNIVFNHAFTTLHKSGMKGLYYLQADKLIGEDGEATVDGVHPTDLGFMRLANEIEKRLRKILKLKYRSSIRE